jgi:hypothetical protein
MAWPVRSIIRLACVAGVALAALGPFTPLAAGASTPTAGGATTPTAPDTTAATPAGQAAITAKGSAAGALAAGSTVHVRFHVTDPPRWQRIDTIHVALELHGAPLDQIEIVPTAFSIAVVGSGAPATIGQPGVLAGTYLRVDNGKATVTAGGATYALTFPLRLALDPPPDARLVLTATDSTQASTGDIPLTPPVAKENQGFPWGTIALAVAAALFVGGFVGNMFSTRRAKARPNIYSTISRRLDEERSKR